MKSKSRVRKKGKTKKVISEWENFWEDYSGFLARSSWKDSRIELLHIAIALQDYEPEEILKDLHSLKSAFLISFGISWNGNLSVLFGIIQRNNESLTTIQNTVFDKACKSLIVTYSKMFGVHVPSGNLAVHSVVYRAYFETDERKKDISILCKFIVTKFLIGEDNDPTGILNKKSREDIVETQNASLITAAWLTVVSTYDIINIKFSEFIWDYNISNLPFIVVPNALKKEIKRFKMNRINSWKKKLAQVFEDFKKIDLLHYFTVSVAEIFMGFIARQQYLAEKVIEQEERQEGEIAESTLRLLYENRVKLIWLASKQDLDALKNFREYKVGREKLFLDFFMEHAKKSNQAKNFYEQLADQFEYVMKSEGVDDYNLAIEKGDSFELSLKDMADEIGGNEPMFYFSIYKRTSDIIHGNWRILEKYHLERSINPAHDGLLRYSSSQSKFAGILPSYLALILSVNTLIAFFDIHPRIIKGNRKLYIRLKKMHDILLTNYLKEFVT